MEKETALKIIQQLANGIHPHTGEVFAADSAYQHPDTVRALFVAARALEAPATTKPRGAGAASAEAPQNSGKPWSVDEDQALVHAFDAGKQIPELAVQHQRSRFAIESRLAKLGKIAAPANMRGFKAASPAPVYVVQH